MGFLDKLFGKEKKVQENEETKDVTTHKTNELAAVLSGEIKPITEAEDPVFAQKMMGDGYLVIPTSKEVVSPVNGVVQLVFPTKHAVGITSDNGDEIIIHVGLDTVKLDGEGFAAFVAAGDKVKVGDKLLEVDFEKIKDKVPSISTPVVISNIGEKKVTLTKTGMVQAGDVVAVIE